MDGIANATAFQKHWVSFVGDLVGYKAIVAYELRRAAAQVGYRNYSNSTCDPI